METTMSNELDIKGIDKAELLAGLYNRSKPLGLGFLQASAGDVTGEFKQTSQNSRRVNNV